MDKKREIFILSSINGTLFLLVCIIALIDQQLGLRLAAIVGTCVLAVLLIAPRLLKIPKLQKWHSPLLAIARNSKWVGIWTSLWFLLHALLAFITHLHWNWSLLLHPVILLGTISLIVFVMLLSISNSWSYAHVKWWKHLSMTIWLLPPLGFTHALLASSHFLHQWPFVTVVLFLIMLAIGLWAHKEPNPGYFTKHRTVLLITGIVLSIGAVWWNYSL